MYVFRTDFSDQFQKIIIHHKRIGYDLNVIGQSVCLVIFQKQKNPTKSDCCTPFFLLSFFSL